MITLAKLRDLDLSAASATGRPTHVSAASGLVVVGATIYVIADDELHLGVFSRDRGEPGRLVRLFDGDLPVAKSDRKRLKPDLEALTLVPTSDEFPHGALLAFGSGSTVGRRRGVVFALDADGALRGRPRTLDLSPILLPLANEFSEINIEGAVVTGGELRLLQRGNRQDPDNAVVAFELAALLDALSTGGTRHIAPSRVRRFRLGQAGDVPLTVTDGVALPDGRIVVSAVAEDTDDAYNDGACVGAAIGVLDAEGQPCRIELLDRPHKIEGIDARVEGAELNLLLVTDDDDAAIPAGLYAARLKI